LALLEKLPKDAKLIFVGDLVNEVCKNELMVYKIA
jgi:hypothetical protein